MAVQTQESAVPVSAVKGIDVTRIEKELASMWTEGGTSEAQSGVTRACTQNLLVYTSSRDDRATIDEMLDTVTEQHPGRTLVLVADREAAEPKLEAYVSTRCKLLGGSARQICGEQVTINAGGPIVETVSSAIAPLLVPDVPVFLWWNDIPDYQDHLFDQMSSMADRIVIDSATFDRPYADLRQLARLIRERPEFGHVSDLNWGRLTPWRMLIASFWDIPDYRPYLDKIESVAIEYDPPDSAPEQIAPKALLIAGWLVSRLGWKVEPNGRREGANMTRFECRAGSRTINLEMRATVDRETINGMITLLNLDAGGEAGFNVALSPDQVKLETGAMIRGERTVGRVVEYQRRNEGQRLSRELAILAGDPVYEEAVASAVQLIDTLK